MIFQKQKNLTDADFKEKEELLISLLASVEQNNPDEERWIDSKMMVDTSVTPRKCDLTSKSTFEVEVAQPCLMQKIICHVHATYASYLQPLLNNIEGKHQERGKLVADRAFLDSYYIFSDGSVNVEAERTFFAWCYMILAKQPNMPITQVTQRMILAVLSYFEGENVLVLGSKLPKNCLISLENAYLRRLKRISESPFTNINLNAGSVRRVMRSMQSPASHATIVAGN